MMAVAPYAQRLADLAEGVEANLDAAFAASTQVRYARDWAKWVRFLSNGGPDPLAAGVEDYMAFLTHLGQETQSWATVEAAAAAINSRYGLAGLPKFTGRGQVPYLMRGIAHKLKRAVHRVEPLTVGMVRNLMDHLLGSLLLPDVALSRSVMAWRTTWVATFCYVLCARYADLTEVSNLHIVDQGHRLLCIFGVRKNDRIGASHRTYVPANGGPYCVARLHRMYLRRLVLARERVHPLQRLPVEYVGLLVPHLKTVGRGQWSLEPEEFGRYKQALAAFQRAMADMGQDGQFAMQSPRRGATNAAHDAGWSDTQIEGHGGWAPGGGMVARYAAEALSADRQNLAACLVP